MAPSGYNWLLISNRYPQLTTKSPAQAAITCDGFAIQKPHKTTLLFALFYCKG